MSRNRSCREFLRCVGVVAAFVASGQSSAATSRAADQQPASIKSSSPVAVRQMNGVLGARQSEAEKRKFIPQSNKSAAAVRLLALVKNAEPLSLGGGDCGRWQPSPEVTCSRQCGRGDFAGHGDPGWLSLSAGKSFKPWSLNTPCTGDTQATAVCQSRVVGGRHIITATINGNVQRYGSCSGCAGSTAHIRPVWQTMVALGPGYHEVLLHIVSEKLIEGVTCHVKIGDPSNPGGLWEMDTIGTLMDQTLDATAVSGNTPITVSCPNLAQAAAYGCPPNYDNPSKHGSVVISVVAGP